nr:MAG TPA: Protein of unknown function (DUF3810) [Caudoviricetes sp.]
MQGVDYNPLTGEVQYNNCIILWQAILSIFQKQK